MQNSKLILIYYDADLQDQEPVNRYSHIASLDPMSKAQVDKAIALLISRFGGKVTCKK